MSGRTIRPLGLALGLAFFVASPLAFSQVTVHVTTAPVSGGTATNCTMTTDSAGLSLVPGSTDLKATGVVFSPAGCGQGTQSLPPTPNGFALNGIASTYSTVPATATVTWSVQNATTCVGIATLNGAQTTIAGWTDNTAASPQSRAITFPTAGAYVLAMQCSNSANPPITIVSGAYATVVSQGGGGGGGACPGPANLTGRLMTSDISYGAYNPQARPDVDVTEWNNIWGYAGVTDPSPPMPWPGVDGAGPVIREFARNKFLAAHFNTGATPMIQGSWAYQSNIGGPNIDVVVSTVCGDFSENTTYPGCSLYNIYSDGQASLKYFSNGGNAGRTQCSLQLNTDYYLNVRYTDPTSSVECPAGSATCPMFLINHGVLTH
jgi:hypothetical protein